MTTVGSFEAKTHLSALLKRVARGETVKILNRGKAVAMLVPVVENKKNSIKEVIERIKQLSREVTLGKHVTIRQLIDEGRP